MRERAVRSTGIYLGKEENLVPLQEFEPTIVDPIAHYCIDSVIRLPLNIIYTGCNRRNVPNFGRVFLMLKLYRYNPKHLYPKLNGLGDNGQGSLKI
jgi:hypothetical protein